MTKARTLANLISDNAELADGQISVAEVVGAAPSANPTFTGNVSLGDNSKAIFGTGTDFEIYSSGTGAKLHANNGVLELEGDSVQIWNAAANEAMGKFTADGAVELYHNGSKKFETTSIGVSVTGQVLGTSTTHAGGATFDSTGTAQLWLRDTDASSNQKNWGFQVSGGDLNIVRANDDRASGFVTPIYIQQAPANSLVINSSGNLGIGESAPLGRLHVKTADSGATVDVSADELVIEGSANAGMTILSGVGSNSNIYFGATGGSPARQNWDGYIAYSQANREMTIGTAAGGGSLKVGSTGDVIISGSIVTGLGSGYATDADITLGSANPAIFFHDTTGGAVNAAMSVNSGIITFSNNSTGGNLSDQTARMTIGRYGHVEILDGDLKFASGHGISFAATSEGSGTMASEILDDYEEGDWTPVVNYGGISHNCWYVKVGNVVTVGGNIYNPTNTTAGYPFAVGGLPFTAKSHKSSAGAIIGAYIAAGPWSVYIGGGTSQLYLYNNPSTGAYHLANHTDMATNSDFHFSMTYYSA